MLIDVHTHIGRAVNHNTEPVIDEHALLRQLDALEIDRAVLLPIVSPEAMAFPFPPEEAIAAARRHPDRLIPFCNVDPRAGRNSAETDFTWMLEEYRGLGCQGLGEITAHLGATTRAA